MGVSTCVVGVRDADGKLGQMVELKTQCDNLDVSYPVELVDYFKGTDALNMAEPEDVIGSATEVHLHDLKIDELTEGDVEYGGGMTINLEKMPDDIKKLRVYMS